jgi:hypothetical protein
MCKRLLTFTSSVKLLSERVTAIEQYLRDAPDRDRLGRLSPKFRESHQTSLDDSDVSKCKTFFQPLLILSQPTNT